jgi:hypothetical protein
MAEKFGVANHPAKAEMESRWRQGDRAKAILQWLSDNSQPSVNESTLSRYGQRYWTEEEVDFEFESDYVDQAESVMLKIKESGIGDIQRVTVSKTNFSIGIKPVVGNKTHIPLQRAPELKITVKSGTKIKGASKLKGWKTGIFLPDMQIGYWNGKNGGQHTTHDEAAIDIAHQILSDLEATYQVDLVINAGDNLDLPALSTHRSAPGFWNTTEISLNRAAQEGAIQRVLAPNAEIVWIAGNHEQRLTNFMIDKVPALMGLTRDGDVHPVMSIPNLCRFDENNIKYLDPYPDAEYWVNEHLRFEHGTYCVNSKGGTAAKHLLNGVSVGYGHIHRSELLYSTRHTKQGPRTHFAGSPGCLCRIDGSVPSSRTGVNSGGSQAQKKTEDWQQGLWVFFYQEEGDQLVSIEPIQIWGQWSMWRGKEYYSTCDADGITNGK